MDKAIRNIIQRATQDARRLIEAEYSAQLEGVFDILPSRVISPEPGAHLNAAEQLVREKIVAALNHEQNKTGSSKEAVAAYLREAAFTTLNRFVALKMMEARGLVQECMSKGEQSSGFREFTGLAPGLAALPDHGYRLYIESLFDEIGREVRVLFDRSDSASLLWPRRQALSDLLDILNNPDLAGVWAEDETIGWIYQYFNSQEERRAMRDESQAPRNSRELAVRNQFFTPQYVVQFLTDNTLGRIWYEMRKGNTALKDECRYLVRRPKEVFLAPGEKVQVEADGEVDLSQEDLLEKPVYIEHRPKKDPRDLKILDPACGSGHFLLYAFELLETIYEEGWADEYGPTLEVTGKKLRDDFTDIEELRREFPRLILEHNLHGIDIDPRAVQIAALALWMRAQKTWMSFGIKPVQRPRIARSNIVTAEPMPGETDMRRELITGLTPRVLGQLVDVAFERMKLAGEAGSLLKIEEEIKDALGEARRQWLEGTKPEQQLLFPGMVDPRPKQLELRFDVKGITDERFWEQAEDLILDALKDYAERAENGQAIRRRLFAEDAARGFAFIDLCRKRYDVVLMNPPFGSPINNTKELLSRTYFVGRTDLYACFVLRAIDISSPQAAIGAITARTGFFLQSFVDWRTGILNSIRVSCLADLGGDVLDAAMVETACYVLQKSKASLVPFFRIEGKDKAGDLRCAVAVLFAGENAQNTYLRNPEEFARSTNKAWSYWMPADLAEVSRKHGSFDPHVGDIRLGVQTNDDFRFSRLWWEVPPDRIGISLQEAECGKGWVAFLKGGDSSKYFADISMVLNWFGGGLELKEAITIALSGGHWSRHIQSIDYYFLPGVSWALRTDYFDPHIVPRGCISSVSRYFAIPRKVSICTLLGVWNCKLFDFLAKLRMEKWLQPKFVIGVIKDLPFPDLSALAQRVLEDDVLKMWKIKCSLARCDESSRYAMVLQAGGSQTLRERAVEFKQHNEEAVALIDTIQSQIERLVSDEFGYHLRELDVVQSSIIRSEPANNQAGQLVSLGLGCILGRWDIRYATGELLAQELPDPFDPLPVCPPGMLVGPDGLPAKPNCIFSEQWLRARPDANSLPSDSSVKKPTIPDSEYPIRISWDGILVDDPGFNGGQPHTEDIICRVREVLDLLSKEDAHDIEQEACDILGVSELREYFRRPSGFFQDHLKRYSKSRRKAPIYWQLASSSGSYAVWLYYHRFTKDTFYKVLNDYVNPKLREEDRRLTNLRQDAGLDPSVSQRNEIETQEGFVEELRTFRDEVARIAPLWSPDLNDGVIINFAPLWRLVPQHRQWQNECKECWDKLVKGEYDWAHLAMHLWPERVVPKCAKDRSLAIAHGLDEFFWYEDKDGKWRPTSVSSEEVERLIREKTSPTVKAALNDLLSTPAQAAGLGRTSSGRGRRRATR